MAPSVSKKQGRRRLSKCSKPEKFLREQENIDTRSKEQSPTPPVSVSIPRITITPPSSVLQIDSCSPPVFLYSILFSGCPDMAFYTQSTDPNRIFMSELEPFAPTSSTPIKIVETYIFDKPCPGCNHQKARIVNENPKRSFFAFPSTPLKMPDDAFLASLEKLEKWVVSWPVVESTIPDAIRRFGKFDFEDDQDGAQAENENVVDGRDRATSLRSYKMTELMPFYVEDLRPPKKDLSTPEEDLGAPEGDLDTPAKESGTPAKKSKARRRWRKVRMVSRTAILSKKLSVK